MGYGNSGMGVKHLGFAPDCHREVCYGSQVYGSLCRQLYQAPSNGWREGALCNAAREKVWWACVRQHIRGAVDTQLTNVSNINVFALCFTIAFSILFIALDLGILRFLVYLAGFRRTRWLAPRIERWIQDGVLQLQRRAFETSGQGTWKDLDKEIPTTTSREFLEDFPSVSPGVSFFEKSEELVAKDEKITPLRESRVHDIDVVDLADCDGADAVCKSPRDAKETADGQDHQRRSSQCVEQTLE